MKLRQIFVCCSFREAPFSSGCVHHRYCLQAIGLCGPQWDSCCLRSGLLPWDLASVGRLPYVSCPMGRLGRGFWMSTAVHLLDSNWNVMANGDAQEGKWRGNWRMEWVSSTLHTTSEHGVSSIITADAHTSAASSRLNLRPCCFKWTRPFRQKTKSGFCACAITFQLASTLVGGCPSVLNDTFIVFSRRFKYMLKFNFNL